MRLIKILLWMDSRKVALGATIFYFCSAAYVATILILAFMGEAAMPAEVRMTVERWMSAVAIAAVLVGGGTLGDKFMDNKKEVQTKAIDAANPAS